MTTSNKSNPPGNNPYARFIPREELGGKVSAWNLETFEAPPVAAEQDVGVRKPTLAERAAAEMRARQKPASQTVHHAEQATGAATGATTRAAAGAARARGG